jgi:hypothetical protein
MAECVYDLERQPSLSVAQWREMLGLPMDCLLSSAQEMEIGEALLQADEDVALYAGWWPAATSVCEEIPLKVHRGSIYFARTALRRSATLRFGKVRAIESVEWLRRTERYSALGVAPESAANCLVATPGFLCLTDSQYGTVALAERNAGVGQCPPDIERVRIRYVSGDVAAGQTPRFDRLLARYAVSLLASPYLCGVDLRGDGWDRFTLTDTTQNDEVQTSEDEEGAATNTTRQTSSVTTKEQLRSLPAMAGQSPFGHTAAGLHLWRYLKPRRRTRIHRV